MNREKNLLKNTSILAVGQLSSKLFTFFLLPLYTAVLLPEDFGTIDVLQTIISLLLYFVTLQIESAVFRFLIECRADERNRKEYIATSLFILLLNSALFTVAILLVSLFVTIPHLPLFILSLWAQGFSYLMLNIARGLGQNILYSITSFVITLVSLAVNLILILGFGKGASSILVAVIGCNFAGGLIIFLYNRLWNVLDYKLFSKDKLKEMLTYSIPLIPNAISWWIANTSDRIIIIFFLGTAMNGIYAAANKIPTIYTTIFNVYNLAWSESVSIAIKDPDCDAYINRMMKKNLKLFSFLGLGIISCISLMFNFLIGSKYSEAYNHVYILIVAVFINSMCSLYGGIFGGFKESVIIGKTTAMGAVVNFLVNIFFVKLWGLYAASISTLISYLVIWFMRHRAVKKYVDVRLHVGDCIQCIAALAVVTFGYFLKNRILNVGILFLLIIWGILSNRDMIITLVGMVKKKVN